MKKIVFAFIVLCSMFSSFLLAEGEPYFYFQRPTGVDRYKLYCSENIDVYVDGKTYNYNSFESYLNFSGSDLQFINGSINLPFQPAGTIGMVGNLYHIQGSFSITPSNPAKVGISKLARLTFKSLKNIVSTNINFVDYNGNNPTYGQSLTSDGISLNSPSIDGKDALGNVNNTTIYFKAEPCNEDGQAPKLLNNGIYSGSTKINNNTGILKNQQLKFTVYDGDENKTNMHWFGGTGVVDYTGGNNFADYVLAPENVDNQAGVNSGTIEVKVSCPTCSHTQSGILTIGDGLNTPDVWGGNANNNRYTWDNKNRGYTVSFNAPFEYEIEKEVNVIVYANDNKGNRFTGSEIKFNKKQDPIITLVKPTPLDTKVDGFDVTDVPPSKTNSIVIGLSDEWAGINTGSVEINISYPVLSGDAENVEYVMTGYSLTKFDFSEDAFSIISGQPGTGNAGSYNLTFYPLENFTVNTGITIVVTGKDLAGNIKSQTFKIRTMDSCEAYGCSDLFYVWTGLLDSKWGFTGGVLQITGNRLESPYPYFESTDSGLVLMCGKDWDDITISTSDGVLVDGLINQGDGYKYTGSELYITGLNYEIIDGVIVVSND